MKNKVRQKSALLFTLAIEPFTLMVKQSEDIQGMKMKGYHNTINLYADNVIIFLANSLESEKQLKQIFDEYESVSGYNLS